VWILLLVHPAKLTTRAPAQTQRSWAAYLPADQLGAMGAGHARLEGDTLDFAALFWSYEVTEGKGVRADMGF
jgi:hypothetical protein